MEAIYFHSSLVTCLNCADDTYLATADQAGVIALWDLDFKGSRRCSFRGILRSQSVGIKQISISQPLQLVLSLDLEGVIFLHDLRSCEMFNILRLEGSPNCAAVSALGLIAVGAHGDCPKIQLYSLNGIQHRPALKTLNASQSTRYLEARREHGIDKDEINWLQFNLAGDFVMSAGTSTFCIWPVYDDTVTPYVYGCNALVRAVSIDPEERQVLLYPHKRDFVLVKRSLSS
jgi:hypothetical protein